MAHKLGKGSRGGEAAECSVLGSRSILAYYKSLYLMSKRMMNEWTRKSLQILSAWPCAFPFAKLRRHLQIFNVQFNRLNDTCTRQTVYIFKRRIARSQNTNLMPRPKLSLFAKSLGMCHGTPSRCSNVTCGFLPNSPNPPSWSRNPRHTTPCYSRSHHLHGHSETQHAHSGCTAYTTSPSLPCCRSKIAFPLVD